MAARSSAPQALGNGGRLAIKTNLPKTRPDHSSYTPQERSPLGKKFNDENFGTSTRTEAILNSDWRNNRRFRSETDTTGQPSLSKPSLTQARREKKQLTRLNTTLEGSSGNRRYRDSPIDPDYINSAPVADENYDFPYEEKQSRIIADIAESYSRLVKVGNRSHVGVLSLEKIVPETESSQSAEGQACMTIAPIQASHGDNETMKYPATELWPVVGCHDKLETRSWDEMKVEARQMAGGNPRLPDAGHGGVEELAWTGPDNIMAMLEAFQGNHEGCPQPNFYQTPTTPGTQPSANPFFAPDEQARYNALMNRLHELNTHHRPHEAATDRHGGRSSSLNPTATEFRMKKQLVEPSKETEWLMLKRSIKELQKTIDDFVAKYRNGKSSIKVEDEQTRNWEPTQPGFVGQVPMGLTQPPHAKEVPSFIRAPNAGHSQDMAANEAANLPTPNTPQNIGWNPAPYPIGLVPMMNNADFSRAGQMASAGTGGFMSFLPGKSAPPSGFNPNALFGPKPVRKPKDSFRVGDPQQASRQQDYEAYLEYRRATDIKYAQACKARQLRRAERQRSSREKSN